MTDPRVIGGKPVFQNARLDKWLGARAGTVAGVIESVVSQSESLSLDSPNDRRVLIERLQWALGLDT